MKAKVYLADLTHTGQGVALNAFPLGMASIASYTLAELGKQVDVRLFKYPEKLIDAVLADPPNVIGFSNYMWNLDLGYTLACEIKRRNPDTVIVFGGPNYDSDEAACGRFLRSHPVMDFYVHREGERPFTELVQRLMDHGFDVESVIDTVPPSCHYLSNGELVRGDLMDRVRDLDEIPSPYTTGMMDQFFDGNLMPLMQTNRGCPFSCTFCVEGELYYNKVSKGPTERVAAELRYIAERIEGIPDLRIADSNFGMYRQDMEICEEIAKVQDEFGWPRYIHVATGKNQKERVLRAADIVNGAMRLSASVQSMDETVLKNIKRQNISADEAVDLAKKGNEVGSNTYSEIILCLPGDTKDAHFKTIKQMVDAGLNFARLFTLMMLPGTELSTEATRQKYEMATRHRVLPRCFGSYDFGGTTLHSLETEEVCVANNTMPFDDYLDCRVMDLFVEVFYNDGIFEELLGLMKLFGMSAFDWVSYLYYHQDRMPDEIQRLVSEFRGETDNELWPSAGELDAHARNEETIRRYVSGELGSNLIFKYKALMVLRHGGAISSLAFDLTRQMLGSVGVLDEEPWLESYLDDLSVFSSARKSTTLDTTIVETHSFGYDLKSIEADRFRRHPNEYATPDGTEITFRHTSEQADYIRRYIDVYGDSVIGLSRILANIFVKRMYRPIEYAGGEIQSSDGPGQVTEKLEIGPFG